MRVESVMKAIQIERFGGPEVLQRTELPIPEIGEDQVLIKVEAIGVNFADILTREGRYHISSPLPAVIGFEVAGTVAKLGKSIHGLREGDPVVSFCIGGYAEYAIGEAKLTYPMPQHLSWKEGAAFLIVFLTAYHTLKTAGRLQKGETVLIHAAAGGVGTAAVQLAKVWGAKVIGTASHEKKLDLIWSLGADAAINYAETDFTQAVQELTGGKGVDVVLECIGGEVFTKSLGTLAPLGRLVAFGMTSGTTGVVEARKLQMANRTVAGISIGRLRVQDPALLRSSYYELKGLAEAKKVHPVIGRIFPLEEAATAHEFISSRGSSGKVLLKP